VTVRRLILVFVIAFVALAEISCGGNMIDPACIAGIRVSPENAAVDHLMPPPGNQQQFLAFADTAPGCAAIQANLTTVTWSVSNTQDATISNASNQTFGTATCRNATSNPVTVTAMLAAGGQILQGAALLTCR
jgi:hypothetical protein